jgi:hypothetical protein
MPHLNRWDGEGRKFFNLHKICGCQRSNLGVSMSWALRVGEQEVVEGKVLREFAPPHKPLWWGQQKKLHQKPKYYYWSLK